MMSFHDINNLEDQTYRPGPPTRENAALTVVPLEGAAGPIRRVVCSCGLGHDRQMGTEAIQCRNCGRRFVWGEHKGDEQFVIS